MSPVHFEIRGDTYTVTCGDTKLVTKSEAEAMALIRQLRREQDRARETNRRASA